MSNGVGTIVEPVRAGATGKAISTILGYVQIGVSERTIGARILSARAELAGIALLTLFLGCVLSMIPATASRWQAFCALRWPR